MNNVERYFAAYHNRRYKLHGRIKKFTRMDARGRVVYLTDSLLNQLNERQRKVVNELKNKYRYNIQMILE